VLWLLDGRELSAHDRLELRLHGNDGWFPIVVEPGYDVLTARFQAEDGKSLFTSLSHEDELRWPFS
jgi:hypothetical protein